MFSKKPEPYPLKCVPLFIEKIWGGRKIEKAFGKKLPAGKKIGESWEVADLKEGTSSIGNGELKGKRLSDAIHIWGKDLIGERWGELKQFPLLIKIIDAQEDLSIQVHPDAESCKKYFPEHYSKDECWIVLDSEEGASIYWGFEKNKNINDYLQHLERGNLTNILRKLIVKKGDCIKISSGTVHSLLKGVMVLEIQEPSDSTFRIYDYGRVGEDGKPRPIHLDGAKKVVKFDWVENPFLVPDKKIFFWGTQEVIIDCPAYRIERWQFANSLELKEMRKTARIIFNLEGKIELINKDSSFLILPGETIIIPAKTKPTKLIAQRTAKIIVAGASGVSFFTKEENKI